MNHHVNAVAGRLSLRPPQCRSLEIRDRVTEIVPPKKGADVAAVIQDLLSVVIYLAITTAILLRPRWFSVLQCHQPPIRSFQ